MFDLTALLAKLTAQEMKDATEVLANVATAVGLFTIPLIFHSYWRETKRQRRDAEITTYLNLNTSYVDWLKLCFDNPELQAPDAVEIGQPKQNRDWKKEQLAFVILTSMFEQAYYLYHDHRGKFKSAQWDGWVQYMKTYCQTSSYIEYWRNGGGQQFDKGFMDFMICEFPWLQVDAAGESMTPPPVGSPPSTTDPQAVDP